jgi:CrcB protein
MFGMKQLFMVALGGAIGSVARYKLGGFALHHTPAWNFPLSTFGVNVLGCFIIGAVAALVEHHDLFSPA